MSDQGVRRKSNSALDAAIERADSIGPVAETFDSITRSTSSPTENTWISFNGFDVTVPEDGMYVVKFNLVTSHSVGNGAAIINQIAVATQSAPTTPLAVMNGGFSAENTSQPSTVRIIMGNTAVSVTSKPLFLTAGTVIKMAWRWRAWTGGATVASAAFRNEVITDYPVTELIKIGNVEG